MSVFKVGDQARVLARRSRLYGHVVPVAAVFPGEKFEYCIGVQPPEPGSHRLPFKPSELELAEPQAVARYGPEDLAWYAETFGTDEWMVHVSGMDDCHLHVNPDLDDDDPANPLLTEETAAKLAADFNSFDALYAKRFPGETPPGITATVFRYGVPLEDASDEGTAR